MSNFDVAYGFAACAHRAQRRKYTGVHYIVHPATVANHCKLAGLPEFVQVAALLHDVVEDTPVTLKEIEHEFGGNVAVLVLDCTDLYTKQFFPGLNRAERKAKERERLSRTCAYSQSIKVADLIDNTDDIVRNDPDFAKVYIEEKRALLAVLPLAHSILLTIAHQQLERYKV